MADFDQVYESQNRAYQEIWDIAQDALNTLKYASSGGGVSIRETDDPIWSELQDLNFDPGAPTLIEINGPVDLDSILNKIDDSIADISNVVSPVFPDAPSIIMEDHEIWNEAFFDDIKTSLADYISTLGIPDVSYQDAIFNEDLARNRIILEDLLELADAKTGARGFTYTNDYGNSLKLDAQIKYQYDRTQVSRSISKLVTEWARANYQFAIEKGIVHQTAHMDFTYKYCTATVAIYKDLVSALLERYKADISVILAPIEAYIKELEAVLGYTRVAADIDKTNEMLKQSRSEIEIKEAQSKYSSEMSRFGSEVSKAVSEYQAKLDAIKQAASQSASMAQATSSTVIGYAKK